MDPNGGSGRGTEVAAVKSPGAAVKSPGTPVPEKRHDPSPTLELRYACNTGSGSTSSLLVGLFCSFVGLLIGLFQHFCRPQVFLVKS
jgi:hypothetical protein